MSEQAIEVAKHYVKFSRKVNDGAYGGSEAEVLIAVPMDADAAVEEIVDKLSATFAVAKSLIFQQLEREHTITDEGVVVEIDTQAASVLTEDDVTMLRTAFGGGELISDTEREALQNNVVQGNFGAKSADYDKAYVLGLDQKGQRAWAEARYESHPNEFWDNRANKRSEKSPDFKHKDTQIAIWAKDNRRSG